MAKSKTRFNNPRRWRAVGAGHMQESESGGYVRMEDFAMLLAAYRNVLCQLDRAGKHVAICKKNNE